MILAVIGTMNHDTTLKALDRSMSLSPLGIFSSEAFCFPFSAGALENRTIKPYIIKISHIYSIRKHVSQISVYGLPPYFLLEDFTN